MLDILLINVPRLSVAYPPAAPSLLKAIVENAGFSAKVKDYNLEFFIKFKNSNDYDLIDSYFANGTAINKKQEFKITSAFDEWVDDIININPKWLGISVFTYECQIATKILVTKLRKKFKGKIVIGGAGISSGGIASDENDFGHSLYKENLIDYYIRGEGDNSLVKLLSGETNFNGINNDKYQQIEDLNKIPFPNYDDIIDLKYEYSNGNVQLPITGSRGCVRDCTFCDIHMFWKKYKYRDGTNIANEIIHHYQKYGTKSFYFTDSLINGSMKSFRDFCKTLILYYENNNLPYGFFQWGGQFIIRNEKQMNKDDYINMKKAGCNGLAMGVESGSNEVLLHMKKTYTVENLDFTIEQLNHNNINCYFLIIVGYPTETLKNFNETIKMFERYQKYALNGTIFGVNLGTTLSIDYGTPLFLNQKELKISHAYHNDTYFYGLNWISENTPELTLEERIKRRLILQEKLMDLGYTVWNGDNHLQRIMASYDKITNKN